MKKIPVGTVIGQAYTFAFVGFLRIIGVIWLPSVILAAGGLLIMRLTGTPSPANVGRTLLVFSPVYLLSFFLVLMEMTGVTELALDRRQGSPYFYFSFGKPLWRVVGAFLLLMLAMIVCAIPFVAGTAAVGVLRGTPIATLVLGLAVFVFFFAYIYILIRCSFLLIPIAVAEEKVDMRRAWALARGNFWRIFVILLAVLAPLIVLEFIFIFQFLLHGMPVMPPNPTPQQSAAYQAAVQAWTAGNTARMARYWYLTNPLYILFMAIFLGLTVGAQCFAYRAITEDERSAIEAF